jgi:hypothetical protein
MIEDIETDIAEVLRFLRSRGLLTSFLSSPEVLGDQKASVMVLPFAAHSLRLHFPGIADGKNYILGLNGDYVTLISLD